MEAASPTIERVQDLWFDDGNLIIQAGNSQYRLFRGILVAQSSVFKDMLSCPQPPDSEGRSIVHLSDSSAEVTAFFRAIFDPKSSMPAFPNETDFDTICACLRLSHKYGVDYLRRRALVHLSSRFPTTLSECDALETNTAPFATWKRPKNGSHRIFLMSLFREVDAIWFLPYTFYLLGSNFGRLGSDIFHGAVYNDTTVGLSREDQDSFLRGYFIQRDSLRNEILRFLWSTDKIQDCTNTAECLQIRLNAFKLTCTSDWAAIANAPLHAFKEKWIKDSGMCPSCLAYCMKAHHDACQAFWDKLPKIYGLPRWEQLEKMKADAIGFELSV
ncbi:hypothetical protein MSAN_01082800 [Mycena sanguinolenta]|uniref:BTB domain-containing protein n=1 Tax=Mycena sanguinolenta TaxID=230812 RepID=A0A8H6YS74_9AGAR|nr:hypothetical protein MSAN_01082800 [Mycena sanguinolenta]